MAQSLKWGLEAEGYVVDLADNGEVGLWKAQETEPDVVLLDVMLPGMDGYQVCAQLRAQGLWMPILMLTAMDDDLDQAEGLDSGADDYLAKPFATRFCSPGSAPWLGAASDNGRPCSPPPGLPLTRQVARCGAARCCWT